MRKITILCLLLACALPALAGTYRADEIPNVQRMDRRRYVSNPDGILSAGAVARIDSLCASLRERGLAQVAVVAVDDIAGGDAFSFAVELFRSWGVGSAKSNNGLGILLVKDLREIRFVTGGGLEGILPDALCKRIQLNYMLPAFREGNYSAGMVAGVGAAATILEGGEVDLGGDADAAHRAVEDFMKKNANLAPTAAMIITETSRYFGIDEEVIKGPSRSREAVNARQAAMYLVRRMTNLSTPDIGREFGKRDHTTVLHSLEQIEKKMKSDPVFNQTIKEITININSKR